MPLLTLEISGLRGFQSIGSMSLAIPNGKAGSGLSAIVGANNAGKSIVVEALRAMQAAGGDRSFPERARNVSAGSRIEIALHYGEGMVQRLRTISSGGSESEWVSEGSFTPTNLLVVASRRAFSSQFGKTTTERTSYVNESPRLSRRLQPLRRWSHEQVEQVFT